jgi:hypothetical protein
LADIGIQYKKDFKGAASEGKDWISLTHGRDIWRDLFICDELSDKRCEFLSVRQLSSK